jgi:hypothetical protein
MTSPPVPPEKDIYTDDILRPHAVPPSISDPSTTVPPSRNSNNNNNSRTGFNPIMIYGSAALLALATVLYYHPGAQVQAWADADTPAQAQRIYPKDFAVLDTVPPPSQANTSTVSSCCPEHSSPKTGTELVPGATRTNSSP